MNFLSLSGFAQKPDALAPVLDGLIANSNITYFDYNQFTNFADFVETIKQSAPAPEIIIGWSLGAQLAARLVAAQIFQPKLLILFCAPFQFISSSDFVYGIDQEIFKQFYNEFIANPNDCLKKFSALMVKNDPNLTPKSAPILKVDDKNFAQLIFWLEELGRFSCASFNLDFNSFPRTLIIHGANDLVISSEQSKIFAEKISNSRLEILANCAHIPYLSATKKIREMIKEEVNKTFSLI